MLDLLKATALSAALAFLFLAAIFGVASERGIHTAFSGEAVALPGEACTINMTSGDTDFDRMHQDFLYCRAVQSCYYGDLAESFDSGSDCVEEINEYIAANPDREYCDPHTTTAWCV